MPPEWLVRHQQRERERSAAFDISSVPTSLPPFGVVRKTPEQLGGEAELQCVYLLVTGQPLVRRKRARQIVRASRGRIKIVRPVAPKDVGLLAYSVRGLEWTEVRLRTSELLADRKSVLVDADFSERGVIERFAEYCFTDGARGVVAVCLTNTYEEYASDDGVTGVVWLSTR